MKDTAALALALVVAAACSRPRPEGRPADAAAERSPPAPVVVRVRYGTLGPRGGHDVLCLPDGTVNETYFNPGFSPHGAEVVPSTHTLAAEALASIWASASDVALALGGHVEAGVAGGPSTTTLEVSLSDGTQVRLEWPEDGGHPDARVQRLGRLL